LKKLIANLFVFAALAVPFTAGAADMKIGFVDGNRLVQEAPQAKAAADRIKSEFKPRQQDLLDSQKQLQERQDRFLKNSSFMSADEKQKTERDLVSAKRELSLKQSELQDDFTIRRNQEMAKVQETLRNTIQEFGKEKGYDLILFDGVSYASPDVDVTEQVLERLKKQQ
jgi:outer membrane protein